MFNKFVFIFKYLYIYLRTLFYKKNNDKTISCIIFSKDRPLQLFSLLESFYQNCNDQISINIIYKASNKKFDAGYNEVKDYFIDKKINFINETSFKENLLTVLKSQKSKYIFFLVDDIIFKSSFSFNECFSLDKFENYILSLRLGSHLNYCYTHGKNQQLPTFNYIENFLSWEWSKGEYDWKYVFSVDGNVYLRQQIIDIIKIISFKAPNSFESTMNRFRYIFQLKKGLCYNNSKVVNLCLNRVQNEMSNKSGNMTSEDLLLLWNQKKKIDVSKFKDINNISAHIEVDNLPIIER